MTPRSSSTIKLVEAHFCLNCEVIGSCRDNCPACGLKQLWPLNLVGEGELL